MLGLTQLESTLVRGVKRSAKGLNRWRNMAKTRRSATELYRELVAAGQIEPLDDTAKALVREYALDCYGSAVYTPWLEFYTAYRGRFIEGWMSFDYYLHVFLPTVNPRKIAHISNIKTYTRSLVGQERVPDIATLVDGQWFDVQGEALQLADVPDYVFAKTSHVYVKADDIDRGLGVYILDHQAFIDYLERSSGDCVVQWPIEPHPDLSRFHPESVATLRVLTYKPPRAEPRTITAHLRLGQAQEKFVSSAGNPLKVQVADGLGRLASQGIDMAWEKYEAHPDTGIRFSDIAVPGFSEAVGLCEALHRKVPQLGIVGWDVVIDSKAYAWIIEWNAVMPGFKYMEAQCGPLLPGSDHHSTPVKGFE